MEFINKIFEIDLDLTFTKDSFKNRGYESGLSKVEEFEEAYNNLITYRNVDFEESKEKERIGILIAIYIATLILVTISIRRFIQIQFETEINESTKTQLKELYKQLKGIRIQNMLKEKRMTLSNEQINDLTGEINIRLGHDIYIDETDLLEFENKFDDIDPKDVYSHFKAGLVDKNHINKETLREFLNRAFNDYESDNPPPKQKLKMENINNDLGIITSVFFNYYQMQTFKHKKRDKYIRLLTDNFIDFDYQKTSYQFRK